MKLDKLFEHLQQQMTLKNIENSTNSTSPSTSQQQFNLLNYSSVVPLNEEDVSQGLLAVGGCRQCSKTFTDRLSLIHHFADHFPNIFYSFEERPLDNNYLKQQIKSTKINGLNLTEKMPELVEQPQQNLNYSKNDGNILGQLGMFLSLLGINSNNCSQQVLSNFLSSIQNNNNFNPSMGMSTLCGTSTTNNSNNFSSFTQFKNNLNINEDKNELTENNLNNSNDQQVQAVRKKRRHTASENNFNYKENWKSFLKNSKDDNDDEEGLEIKSPDQPELSELPYHMCPHCCLTFSETNNYKIHLEMHQQTASNPSEHGAAVADNQKFKQKCPFCEMEFNNIFRLNEHINLHNAHSCDICEKTFMTAFDLNLHMGTHTGFTYDCKDCGKCFPCRKTLAEHNKSHRIILSNTHKINEKNKQQLIYDLENSQNLKYYDNHQDNDQNVGRKKVKAARKGEKSRRNATLVALEATTNNQQNNIKTTISSSNSLNQTSLLNISFINSQIDEADAKTINNDSSPALGIMGNILMQANSLLNIYKMPESDDRENDLQQQQAKAS